MTLSAHAIGTAPDIWKTAVLCAKHVLQNYVRFPTLQRVSTHPTSEHADRLCACLDRGPKPRSPTRCPNCRGQRLLLLPALSPARIPNGAGSYPAPALGEVEGQ